MCSKQKINIMEVSCIIEFTHFWDMKFVVTIQACQYNNLDLLQKLYWINPTAKKFGKGVWQLVMHACH